MWRSLLANGIVHGIGNVSPNLRVVVIKIRQEEYRPN